MSARATIRLLLALCLGITVGTASDAKAQEEKPEAPVVRPVEDPTIYAEEPPEEETEVETEKQPEAGPDVDAGPDESTPEEPPTAEPKPEERTTGGAPVEDPTLDVETEPDELPPSEEEPIEEPAVGEEKEPPEEEADKGADVKVIYDRGFLLSVDDWFYLALNGLVQARYTVNYRNETPVDPMTLEQELNVTQGFEVPRARFTLGIGLTEFVALIIRLGVVAGGDFSFQRAFIDLKWKNFRLRGGLFMNELIAESLVNPWDLYFADYTIVENVFTPGSSKGVMMTYLRRHYSVNLGYSDGLRTGFSEIRSPSNADFAVTARGQYAWGKLGLIGFNRLNSRRGTPFGVRLGGAIHYQNGGRTQGSLPSTIALGTVDLSVRGSGWAVLFSAIVGQDSSPATEITDARELVSSGVALMGGYFVLEDLEIFGQYSIVPKPGIQGAPPPGVEPLVPSTFQAIGLGLSYFIIPRFDNVKLTSDFQYFIGREAGSLVPASPLNSVSPNDAGSQFAWRIQITAAF